MLQQMLHREEKMLDDLGSVNQESCSTMSTPNFLPHKMKALLAELAMVENEIARLECQISQLQTHFKLKEQVTQEPKQKLWHHGTFNKAYCHKTAATEPGPSPISRVFHQRMSFETRALHFINKAIKGDYKLKKINPTVRTGYPRNCDEQTKNHIQEELQFQEKVTRKSGTLKPSSPYQDLIHSSAKPQKRNSDIFPKSMFNPLLSEYSNQKKWQPNKLSEDIIECLNLIYVRLLRMSRAMELEKFGPLLKSLETSFIGLRGDSGLNCKPSFLLPRESRQQDPYGIFDIEESIPRDIGPYKNLAIFTTSSMDPKFISNSGSIPLLEKLRVLMNDLQTIDLRYLNHQQKLAFWINIHNACIMHGFLQYGVPSAPEKLLAFMNKATLKVEGNNISAKAIEDFILRKRVTSSADEPTDPNVTFALCRGTRSSPAVRIYTSDGVTSELEKSKLDYLQASIIVTSTKRIAIPELLLKNMHDFAGDTDSLLEWVCQQLPTSVTLRKSMLECFRGHNTAKASSAVDKIPYDCEFQYLLTV